MGETADVDRTELKRDIERIKEAMGIVERNESAPEQWLIFGVLIAIGAAMSQYVILNRLDGQLLAGIWIGFVGIGSSIIMRWRYDGGIDFGSDGPNIGFQMLVIYAGAIAVQFAAEPIVTIPGYLEVNAFWLGVILLLLGVGYIVSAETLKAYHIRTRDRRAFQVGGLLLVALGIAIPHVELLHTWGYAAFGASYLVYAVAAYAVLKRE